MRWDLLGIGALVGLAVVTVDELLRFAHHKTIVTVTPDVQPGPTFVLVPELENGW